jgi:hypothetical protein
MLSFQRLSTALKPSAIVFFLALSFSFAPVAAAQEVYLYDSTGQYVGFYDPAVESIYLSNGEPVAYIDKNTGGVYGYNGKILGWYSDGTIRDTNGLIIGFAENNVPSTVQIKRPTNIQIVRKPIPSPVRAQVIIQKAPTFRNEFSPTPFGSVYVYPEGTESIR